MVEEMLVLDCWRGKGGGENTMVKLLEVMEKRCWGEGVSGRDGGGGGGNEVMKVREKEMLVV